MIQIVNRSAISAGFAIAVLALFLAYLFLQHRMVFPYHDDWGMAVLDFDVVVVEGFTGRGFSLRQALEFLHEFYMKWGGRVVPFFVQIYVFKGGVETARVVQVATVMLATLLVTRLATEGRYLSFASFLPTLLYCAVPVFVAARGMYWFSASSHSLWGLPLLYLGVIVCGSGGKVTPLASALFCLAALFNEMMAAATLVILVFQIGRHATAGVTRQAMVRQIALALPTALSMLVVVLAPGNFSRASMETYGQTGKVAHAMANASRIGDLIMIHADAKPFLYIWLYSMLALALTIGVRSRARNGAIAAMVSGVVIAVAYQGGGKVALGACLLTQLALLILAAGRAATVMVAFVCCAIAALVPVLASPAVYPRSLMNFYFLLFVPISWSLVWTCRCDPRAPVAVVAGVALCSIPVFRNANTIYEGYAASYDYHAANERVIKDAAQEMRVGTTPTVITYYRLPTNRFSEVMPYQRPAIERWIRKYYALPDDIRFEYRDPSQLDASRIR